MIGSQYVLVIVYSMIDVSSYGVCYGQLVVCVSYSLDVGWKIMVGVVNYQFVCIMSCDMVVIVGIDCVWFVKNRQNVVLKFVLISSIDDRM